MFLQDVETDTIFNIKDCKKIGIRPNGTNTDGKPLFEIECITYDGCSNIIADNIQSYDEALILLKRLASKMASANLFFNDFNL